VVLGRGHADVIEESAAVAAAAVCLLLSDLHALVLAACSYSGHYGRYY
jgi:hypothetical protein